MVLEFHELEYHQKIFSKFEDYLKKKKNSSFMASSIFTNSSFKKVINPYIFSKQ